MSTFFYLAHSRALFGVCFDFLYHILIRRIDMRMRNGSKHHSLLYYHLICSVADRVLFAINPTTLSTNIAQKSFFYFLTNEFEISLLLKIPSQKRGQRGRHVS